MTFRSRGTNRSGGSFSDADRLAVWRKGRVVTGVDPAVRRVDACGAWIDWAQYGVTVEGGTGWEIDHIQPVSKDGSDDLSNLQPLQWQNNRRKGDDWPNWNCAIKSA